MIQVNRYIVRMFENGRLEHSRSNATIATSEKEAIEKLINDSYWYDEGVGHDYKKIKYPVTFKAEALN